MKRVFCPKCDNQLTFDDTKYPEGKVLAFVCPQCGAQFKIKLGRKLVKNDLGKEVEVKEPDFSCGHITVIENAFAFKQELPLVLGDNVVGRRNKDTDGVDVPIVTSDPSMGRKHCVINVKQDANGRFIYGCQWAFYLYGSRFSQPDGYLYSERAGREEGAGARGRWCYYHTWRDDHYLAFRQW